MIKANRTGRAGAALTNAQGLVPPALDRGRDSQRFPVFGDGPARDVDAVLLQHLDQLVVGQDVLGRLIVDQRLDAEAYGFRRMCLAAARAGDRRGEELF